MNKNNINYHTCQFVFILRNTIEIRLSQILLCPLLPSQSKLNMESLSKPELLMLFSILEGELEARDLVIDALKVPIKGAGNIIITLK